MSLQLRGSSAAALMVSVKQYGAKGDGTTDDTAAIQAAHDAIFAAGGGALFLPAGTYKTTAPIIWKTKVSLFGTGIATSVIKPVGDVQSAIKNITDYTAAAPMTDVTFADFAIDGSAMTIPGAYSAYYKGFYITQMKRCHWRNVYVHHTPSSGFGVDFLVDCTFVSCIADTCGRLNDGSGPGGAGFGIGAGGSTDEHVVIANCTARNSGRHGVFFERQDPPNNNYAGFAKVVNCHLSGNHESGVVNAGVLDFHVRGNTIINNTGIGIGLYRVLTASFGSRMVIADNTIGGNGTGFHVDISTIGAGTYTMRTLISGNVFRDQVNYGLYVSAPTGVTIRELAIRDNIISESGKSGIHITGTTTGAYVDLAVQNNLVRNSGMTDATAKWGIYLGAPITRGVVTGNDVSGATGDGLGLGAVAITNCLLTLNQLSGNVGSGLNTGTATLTNTTSTGNIV